MWLMKASKNFEKIFILKIGELVSFWGAKTHFGTGKSLSEVLIYSSINPQYDNRLFNDFQVQYKKITRVEHVKNMLFTQIV